MVLAVLPLCLPISLVLLQRGGVVRYLAVPGPRVVTFFSLGKTLKVFKQITASVWQIRVRRVCDLVSNIYLFVIKLTFRMLRSSTWFTFNYSY